MKRSLIASFAALSMVAAPALAATTTTPAPAKVAKYQKPSKLAGAKVTKAAAKTHQVELSRSSIYVPPGVSVTLRCTGRAAR